MSKKDIFKIAALLLICLVSAGVKAQPKKNKSDTGHKNVRPLQDVKSKEIVTEFPCNADATIFLENILRRVNILTTNENKVRLVTTVYYQGDPGLTDAEWLQKLELEIRGTAGNVVVKSGNMNKPGAKVAPPSMPMKREPDTLIANAIAVFDSMGQWVNRKSNIKRNIILYIPAGAKLDIESKYADIMLENDINELKARITNGGLTIRNAEKLDLTSIYGRFYSSSITNAEVEVTNGRFSSKNIGTLLINSKNSSVESGTIKQLKLKSQADQYEIEEVGIVTGEKNYGDFRVTSLKTSLGLTGVNSNIKIRSIEPNVNLIKIDGQYADIRLPVGSLKNYAVNFEGIGSNVYTPFEKTNATDSSFSARVGTGQPTNFQVKCNNCTVDFK